MMTAKKHFKRLRMQFDFRRSELPAMKLPDGYKMYAWHPILLERHARANFDSFDGERDCDLFPSLRTYEGCEDLMRSIITHTCFLPLATWLIEFEGNEFSGPQPVATIQGMWDSSTLGAIQNVGVVPEHRGFGLGRAILIRSLAGFQQAGIVRVSLNVTAENTHAVSLYRSVGFQQIDVTYKELPETLTEV